MKAESDSQHIIKREISQCPPGHVITADYFYYDTEPGDPSELAIICGGHEKCAADFVIRRSNYPHYVIKYTLRGKGVFRIYGKVHPLQAGVISGFAPGEAHEYRADEQNPMEHIFFVFTGRQAGELLRKSTLDRRGAFVISDYEKIQSLVETILKNGFEKNEHSQPLCAGYLRVLLLEVYRTCRKYIHENFSAITSPAQAADACYVNVRYMSRLFKKYSQTTPHEYITRLKLNKAGRLLLNSNQTIGQIAQSLGFYDPYHFSRRFKKFFGASPQQYRNIHL
jgi:AraC-like DNA-binding protein